MNTDPPRLHDDPSVPDELRELVGHGQPPPPLDAATRAASLAQLGSVGAVTAVTATGAKLWLVIGGLGVATLAAVVVKTSISADQATVETPTPRLVVEAEPPAVELPAHVEPEVTEMVRSSPRAAVEAEPRRERPSNTAAAADTPTDTLALEAGILEQARVLLATDPRATLVATRRHAREHPRGQLRAEREFIAIDALRRLGRRSAARRRASAFLRSAPTGIYAERARHILEELESTETD